MKILVISRNAWDDTNAIGNTISNFFGKVEGLEFANIYFRSARPNNQVCKRYYRVTEGEIVKKWFSPKKIGNQFEWVVGDKLTHQVGLELKEKRLIHFIHKRKLSIAYTLSDCIWYSKKWINEGLNRFIEDFSPDLVFAFVKSAPQYYLTIRYLRERFGVPVFSWVADDEYTGLQQKKRKREIENLRYILRESALVRGCSQELCDYYNAVFSCNMTPLYKGCDLTTPVKTAVNDPVRLVYAGNLLYGRLDILKQIADMLEICTADGKPAVLDIYSNTLLTAEDACYFSKKACVRYWGQQDYEIIKRELASADVVLHVESFDAEELLKTRYSFSTKIIDALQSGSVLLAIGPEEQASMRYIRGIPGACVICDPLQMREEIMAFLTDATSFCRRAEKIRMFAQQHHDGAANARQLCNAMKKIVEGVN